MSFDDRKRPGVVVGPTPNRAGSVPRIERCPESSKQLRCELPPGLAIAVEESRDLPAVLPEFVGELRVTPPPPADLGPDHRERGRCALPELRTTTSSFHKQGVLSTDSAVNRHVLATASGQLPFVSMSASTPGEDSTLGQRLEHAIELDGWRSQTDAENKLMLKYPDRFRHRGFLSSYITGRRGRKTPDSKLIKLLADFFHVEFEWLLLGSGPIRRDGRGETPAERAMIFARTIRIREDAWDRAWEENRHRAEEMDEAAWFAAIEAKAKELTNAGVPPPSKLIEAMDGRAKVSRVKRRKERALERAREADSHAERQSEVPPVVRVVGGK